MAARYPKESRLHAFRHVSITELERALEHLTQEVAELKRELNTTFQHLHQMLAQREDTLITELDAIPAGISSKITLRRENLEQLTRRKEETERELQANELNKFLQQQLSSIQKEMDRILSEQILLPRVSLSCQIETIQRTLEENCHIVKPLNPCTFRTLPVWNSVKKDELEKPAEVCTDPKSRMIYVADGNAHRIHAFTSESRYHSTLYNEQLSYIYTMNAQGNCVFVYTENYSFFKLNLKGVTVKRVITDTDIIGMFIEDAKIYTCTHDSPTVQVYDLNLKPIMKIKLQAMSFGKDAIPRHIFMSKEKFFVFLLNSNYLPRNPDPIQIFQLDGTHIRSVATQDQIKYGVARSIHKIL